MYNLNVHDSGDSDNPHTLIGGSENNIDCHIDWFTASYPLVGQTSDKTIFQGFQTLLGVPNELLGVVKPRPGFYSAMEFQIGRIDLGSSDSIDYLGFVLTGKDLERFRYLQGSEQNLVRSLAANRGKSSRVDLAINIRDNPDVKISDLVTAVQGGQVSTAAKNSSRVEDLKTGGQTLYLGSRSSDLMFRGYDKAIQSGNLDVLWSRLEVEAKRKTAIRICNQIASLGVASSCRFWFEKFGFQVPWFQAVLDSLSLNEPESFEYKKANRRKWLETQVLPALRNMQGVEHQDLAWFVQTVAIEFYESFSVRNPYPPTLSTELRRKIFGQIMRFCRNVLLLNHK